MRITIKRIGDIMGSVRKPCKIVEQQLDGHNDKLAEMAKMDWDKIPDHYLPYYFYDLAYVDLQPDLFRHLFPACLRFWYDTLMRNETTERGGADFQFSFMTGMTKGLGSTYSLDTSYKVNDVNTVEKLLSEPERQRIYKFFQDGLLDRIEQQSEFPPFERVSGVIADAWVYRFNTLGIIAPIVSGIWQEWWSLDQIGKALCAFIYASGLIYCPGENPLFHKWTPEKGGGGPYLTENDSTIYDWPWRNDNLAFLQKTLSADYIVEKLHIAIEQLTQHPDYELAAQIAADAKNRTDIISIRIDDMLENLAKATLKQVRWN